MSKKFTAIAVSIFVLVSAVTLLADEKADEEKAPALHKELESHQLGDLPQPPPAEAAQPAARRRIRARRDNQVEIDVERRVRVDREQPPVHQQAPPRLRQFLQTQNRWFNTLKDAYREGDLDRIGRLIRRMEQFRKQMRNRMEAAQQLRPIQQQRRRADEGYQQRGRMRNFRGQRRDRGLVDEAPTLRRQLRQQQLRRFRMQDVPDRQLRRSAEPPHQGYCENCDCEKCRQLRSEQQQRLQPPMGEERIPGRLGPYEEQGFRQRRFRRQGPWQQQWQPKDDVPENEELDFSWDW